jgi:hypothetical protein
MSDYKARLARALEAAKASGISSFSALPPFLRIASNAGLPVRPLHFMSVPGLLAFLVGGISLLTVLSHWLALSIEVDAWAVRTLRDLGLSGAVAFGVFAGILTAIVIRFQALRADLPAWRDL